MKCNLIGFRLRAKFSHLSANPVAIVQEKYEVKWQAFNSITLFDFYSTYGALRWVKVYNISASKIFFHWMHGMKSRMKRLDNYLRKKKKNDYSIGF